MLYYFLFFYSCHQNILHIITVAHTKRVSQILTKGFGKLVFFIRPLVYRAKCTEI